MLNQIPVVGAQTLCVEDGALTLIALASGVDKASLRVTDGGGGAGVALELANASARLSWPSSMMPRDRTTYRLTEPGRSQVDLTVRIVPSGSLREADSVKTLQLLDEHDCKLQYRLALRDAIKTK